MFSFWGSSLANEDSSGSAYVGDLQPSLSGAASLDFLSANQVGLSWDAAPSTDLWNTFDVMWPYLSDVSPIAAIQEPSKPDALPHSLEKALRSAWVTRPRQPAGTRPPTPDPEASTQADPESLGTAELPERYQLQNPFSLQLQTFVADQFVGDAKLATTSSRGAPTLSLYGIS